MKNIKIGIDFDVFDQILLIITVINYFLSNDRKIL